MKRTIVFFALALMARETFASIKRYSRNTEKIHRLRARIAQLESEARTAGDSTNKLLGILDTVFNPSCGYLDVNEEYHDGPRYRLNPDEQNQIRHLINQGGNIFVQGKHGSIFNHAFDVQNDFAWINELITLVGKKGQLPADILIAIFLHTRNKDSRWYDSRIKIMAAARPYVDINYNGEDCSITVLHWAVQCHDEEVVHFLLQQNGIDINKHRYGSPWCTPLGAARGDIRKMLEEALAHDV